MYSKYKDHLIISIVTLVFTSLLFYVFAIMPIVNIIKNEANVSDMLIIFSLPVALILLFSSFCFFIISLVRFLKEKSTKPNH